MAELLYRIGRFAVRRSRTVVAVWAVVLVASVVAYLVGAGTLATNVSIPGTPTAEVTDRLAEELPEASGGTGSVVLATSDGEAFTDPQREAVRERIDATAGLDGVRTVVDPFQTEDERTAAQEQLDQGAAQIDQARGEIEAGQAEIDAARTQLEQGQAELDAGQEQLDAARAQAEAAGMLELSAPQLDAQQAELDAARAQLDAGLAEIEAGQAELDTGLTELETQSENLESAATLLELAAEVRTVSADGSAAVATVVFEEASLDVPDEVKESVVEAFTAEPVEGVDVEISAEITAGVPEILGVGEVVGVVVAAVVLLVMLGTAVAAALPIVTALVGVAVGALVALSLSGVVDMISVTPVLGVMLGLAVGIDYSLFIVNRHRRQLLQGYDIDESIGLANGTSGNAVVFAGATVLIALLALNVTGVPFLGLMGTVAALCVAVAVLVAVTLTPAILGMLGTRVLRKRDRARAEAEKLTAPAAGPSRPMATWSAVVRVLVGVTALLVLAVPAMSLRLGLPDGSSEPEDSTQYRAYTTVAEKFGEGINGTLLVVADLASPVAEEDLPAVQAEIGSRLAEFDDVVAVAPAATSADLDMLTFQVIPAEGPNSVSTEELVHAVRDASGVTAAGDDVELSVAGLASGNVDISEKLADALPVYLAVVVGLSIVILVLVFRSLLVPVIATAGFVLSYFAAVGGVVAIYQWGWLGDLFGVHAPGPVLSFLPTILVGVLFGLAMDYMLFIGSGMREAYAHGAPPRLAVVQGLHAGRAVVTAAAIIMASVFGGFVFSHTAMIRPIGFALAFGVLLDAFVVRMLLVPALMHLAGAGAWWLPGPLARILPDVDVEGAKLERRHPHVHEEHTAHEPSAHEPSAHRHG